jgi:hypothetical protein
VADIVLALVILAEIVVAMAAIGIAYKVSTLVGRSPIGWVLLTMAVVLILFGRFFFLAESLITPAPSNALDFIGQALGLPAFFVFMLGMYYLYRDMKTQMVRRQTEILVSEPMELQQ